jgi:GLPGLI family protein
MSINFINLTIFLFVIQTVFSQNGVVTFKNSLIPPDGLKELKSKDSKTYQKVFFMYKNMKETTDNLSYTLVFNKTTSHFKTNQVMTNDKNQMSEMFKDNTEYYFKKNHNKRYEIQKLNGKEIIIREKDIDWNILKEFKTIEGYKCLKAKATQLFLSVDRQTQKVKTKKQPIIAWFTSDIPFPFGPENYGGLPGLVLELKTQGNHYIVDDININFKNSLKIKLPNIEKAISEKESAMLIYNSYSNMIGW